MRGWKTIVICSISTYAEVLPCKCVKYYVNIKENVVEGVICCFLSLMFLLLLN